MSSSVGEDGKSAPPLGCAGAGGHERAAAAAVAVAAAVEELDGLSAIDLDLRALAAVLRLPLTTSRAGRRRRSRRPLARCCEQHLGLVARTPSRRRSSACPPTGRRLVLAAVDGEAQLEHGASPTAGASARGRGSGCPTSVTRLMSPAISPHPPLRDRRSRHRDSPGRRPEVARPDLPRDDVSPGDASRCRRS